MTSVSTNTPLRSASSGNRRDLLQASLFLSVAVCTAGLARQASQRTLYADKVPLGDLNAQVPIAFDGWQGEPLTARFVVDPTLEKDLAEAYDAMLTRRYVDSQGRSVSLVLAYVREVSDGRRVHDPEVCYPAQGFAVMNRHTTRIAIEQRDVPAVVFNTSGDSAEERVLYWIVEGPTVATSNLGRKLNRMRLGFAGFTADGLLVRLSATGSSVGSENGLFKEFLLSLARHTPTGLHSKLLGAQRVAA